MAHEQHFEIPVEFRQLAQKNVDQARMAYGQLMDALAQVISAWSIAAKSTPEFKTIQERAIQFAKQNAEAGFTLASDLAEAKDLQEVLVLQSRFGQAQMSSCAAQAQELGSLIAETARSMKQKEGGGSVR